MGTATDDDAAAAATSEDASSTSQQGGGGGGGVDVDDDRRRGARLQWRLEEVRVIKYGTLARLVAALSDDAGQMDVSNVNTFMTTCRTFASTADVVDQLIKRSAPLAYWAHSMGP